MALIRNFKGLKHIKMKLHYLAKKNISKHLIFLIRKLGVMTIIYKFMSHFHSLKTHKF